MPTDQGEERAPEQKKLTLSERLNALFTGDAQTIEDLRKENKRLKQTNAAAKRELAEAQAMLEDIEGAVKKREQKKK